MDTIPFEQKSKPWLSTRFFEFRVGTVHGLYCFNTWDDAVEILAVKNEKKGNGHFKIAMDFFERFAQEEGLVLRLLDVWNLRLYWNSVKYHGYKRKKGTLFTLEKQFNEN